MKPLSMRGGENRRISYNEYEDMVRAYREIQTVEHVCEATGVSYSTARKYINKGDPARKLLPLKAVQAHFEAGLQAKREDEAKDIIRRRQHQFRTAANAYYAGMYEEIKDKDGNVIETMIKIPDKWYDNPVKWINIVREELGLKEIHEKKIREASAGGPQHFTVDMTDPRMKVALEKQIKVLAARTLAMGIRAVIKALDPTGEEDFVSRLPVGLQMVCLLDPEDPAFLHQGNELVRQLTGGRKIMDAEIFQEHRPAEESETTPAAPGESHD